METFLETHAAKNCSDDRRAESPNRDLKLLPFQYRIRPAKKIMMVRQIVGASVPRKEGWDKVTGAARYVDDMVLPGMLHGSTVRSNVARGKIRKITFDPSIAWGEFVVVTAKDNPGKNCIALILEDQP